MIQPTLTTRDLLRYLQRHQEQFSALTTLLLEENCKFNLTRITDLREIRLRHYLDSLAVLLIQKSEKPLFCIDIGSGAGFPVLPLAIVRPGWRFVSVEATGKKADFQRKACRALGLDNVEVVSVRAEELAHDRRYRERFDAALERAVAELAVLAELMLGFVRPGGRMIAWKGPDVDEELKNAQAAFEKMGASPCESANYFLEDGESETAIRMKLVTATKQHATAALLPRHFGQIKRRPL